MYVFVVTASWISQHTVMTEVRGVYAHMHQTLPLTRLLRAEGTHAIVTKHEVTGLDPVGEGGQTDPSVAATRAADRAL